MLGFTAIMSIKAIWDSDGVMSLITASKGSIKKEFVLLDSEPTASLVSLNAEGGMFKQVRREKLVLATGHCQIKDADFTLLDSIELSGDAKLIIEDAIFRHLAPHSGAVGLVARDNAQVIIKNSIIESDNISVDQRQINRDQNIPHFNNWTFEDGACLVLENVRNISHGIWYGFTQNASGTVQVKDSDFGGTFNGEGSVQAMIDNSGSRDGAPYSTFVEIVEPPGSRDALRLPQNGYAHLHVGKATLHVSGVEMKWGLTINPGSEIEIEGEDYTPLTVTMVLGGDSQHFHGKKVEITDLFAGPEHRADDLRLKVPEFDITLRLKSIQPKDWSPIVRGENEVTFCRGNFADNIWSELGASVTYIDAVLSQVQIKDVSDPAKLIRLVNCTIANVVANAGHIEVEGGVIKGMAVGTGAGKVSLRGTIISENSISGNVERL